MPQVNCYSIGFIALGSLPFQLASLPLAHCHFIWLHCHGFIAVSIGFIAMGSVPFQLASMPQVHCHSIGFIAFSWVHCPSNRDTATNLLLTCLPLTKSHWLSIPICLLAPHLPFGAPIRLSAPPFHWQPKGTSSREMTLVLWRAYQQFVK